MTNLNHTTENCTGYWKKDPVFPRFFCTKCKASLNAKRKEIRTAVVDENYCAFLLGKLTIEGEDIIQDGCKPRNRLKRFT